MKSDTKAKASVVTSEKLQAALAFFHRAKDIAHAAKAKARRVKAELKQAKRAAKHAKKAFKVAKASLAAVKKAAQKAAAKADARKGKSPQPAKRLAPRHEAVKASARKTSAAAAAGGPKSAHAPKVKTPGKPASINPPGGRSPSSQPAPGSINVPRDWETVSDAGVAGPTAAEITSADI